MSDKGTSTNIANQTEVADQDAANFDLAAYRIKLMLDEPFYAAVLRPVTFIRTTDIPTAGVLAKDGDISMWWNPRFVAGLQPDHVIGLLKHEAMHLALEHTTTRRYTPHIIHNYAADLAINSDIPAKELPPGGLMPGEAFDQLTDKQKSNMDQQEIERYNRISDMIANMPKCKSTEWYFTEIMNDQQIREDIEESQKYKGKSLAQALKDGDVKFDEDGNLVDADGNEVTLAPGSMDDHDGWDELTEEQRELVKGKIAKSLEEAVREADRSGRWGSVSASLRKDLRERVSKQINWRALLKNFCGNSRRANRSSNIRRLNRKYPGIHPGAVRGYTSSIAVYIDQSGSVGDAELELAFAELRNLAKNTTFTTFHFDTSVDLESETIWSQGKTPAASRTRAGGTCFQAVVKHVNANTSRFDGCLVITDGEAAKPEPCRVKLGWLLVPGTKLLFTPSKRDFVMQMKAPKV